MAESTNETFEFSYSDLRARNAQALLDGETVESYFEVRGCNRLEVLCLPAIRRAGVAWGADADWYDADTCADALRQYDAVRYTLPANEGGAG